MEQKTTFMENIEAGANINNVLSIPSKTVFLINNAQTTNVSEV